MTPLAMLLTKQLTEPVSARESFWQHNRALLNAAMSDIHCFECTQVLPMLADICSMMKEQDEPDHDSLLGNTSFLPAPKTWIEWFGALGRVALLCEDGENGSANVTAFWDKCAYNVGLISTTSNDHYVHGQKRALAPTYWVEAYGGDAQRIGSSLLTSAHQLLLIINSPRLIGRKQHMPHRGIERKLANAKGLVGKFPLHAWTELKLSVADIGKRADGTEYEAHYTGEKCLHFCRSHLRVRNGRLERVSAHWRGNPALGIKQTRYAVTP